MKFAFRKNIRGGCVLFRPRICFEGDPRGRTLCPLRAIWPLIRDRTPDGERLFPDLSPCSFNRILKAIVTKLGFAGGPKFPLRAFRRGETQEIKDIGPTLSVIIKSGTWAHSGYRAYLDLQADYAINISWLIIDALGSDSDDPDPQRRKDDTKNTKTSERSPRRLRRHKQRLPLESPTPYRSAMGLT